MSVKVALDQSGDDEGLSGVADPERDAGPQGIVVVNRNGCPDHPGRQRPARPRSHGDQGAGGNAGGRPEDGDAFGFQDEADAEAGNQEIGRADDRSEPDPNRPPPGWIIDGEIGPAARIAAVAPDTRNHDDTDMYGKYGPVIGSRGASLSRRYGPSLARILQYISLVAQQRRRSGRLSGLYARAGYDGLAALELRQYIFAK